MERESRVHEVEHFSTEELNVIAANKRLHADTIEAIIRRAVQLEKLPADIVLQHVGRWTWLRFPEKPDYTTRRNMLKLGFFWNRKRGVWCHKHGVRSSGHLPKDFDPRWKYETSTVILDKILEEVGA